MREAWFSRAGLLTFWPIRWQGWALIALFWGIEYPVLFVGAATSPETLLSKLCGIAGVLIFFTFFAVVVLKTEGNYGR
jgi:hypothetical protein